MEKPLNPSPTGLVVKVKRDNVWRLVDVGQLTDAEWDEVLPTLNRHPWWIKTLGTWIRDNHKGGGDDAGGVR